ncbi:hypothetical protein [Mesorhizobium prunaredense]|nr:hypothetical protein [Mesorhizobium prunaredense]
MREQIISLGQAAFADVTAAIERRGLSRDPDLGSVEVDGEGRPSLATWSGADGDDREVDYRRDKDQAIAWLEIRGEDAAELAGTLAAELGGKSIGSIEDLVAGVMAAPSTVRRQERTEHASGRWHRLQAAVAVYGQANAMPVRAMIRAGLQDPDWRVRMTAMLAIGQLRLADLAPLAFAARVPQASRGGVSQADRRMLLALRQASHDFAKGLPPSAGPGDGADAGIAAMRRDFQARLHRLLAGGDIDASQVRTLFLNLMGKG